MSTKTKKPAALSLKDAFETEFARREMERRARDEAGNGYDYTEFCMGLGGWDEPLYWTPDTGQGTVEVGADGKALVVRMRVEGAGDGPFDVVASVNLP